MFPPDRTSYPETAFDPSYLHTYRLLRNEMDVQASVHKEQNSSNNEEQGTPEEQEASTSRHNITPAPESGRDSAMRKLFDVPSSLPLTSTPAPAERSLDQSLDYTSFSKMLAENFQRNRMRAAGPKKPNMRCPKACILTTEDHANLCEQMEKERNEKENKKMERRLKAAAKKVHSVARKSPEPTSETLDVPGIPARSPEPTIPSDIVKVCQANSSSERSEEINYYSEDSLGISSSDEDSDVAYVHFKKRHYEKIPSTLKEGDYYTVDAYETLKSRDQYYIGRITTLNKATIEMKFLNKTRKVPNQYDWPVKNDVLKGIDPQGLFVGPIGLKGTCPYIIMGLDEAYKSYQSHTGN